jgi:benzoylformate decarboxylase
MVLQPPAGPVFLSIPMDDWAKPALRPAHPRDVSHRVGPDPDRLAHFADRINRSANPALVMGPEVDRAGGWDSGIELAEKLQIPSTNRRLPIESPFPKTIRCSRARCRLPSQESATD